MKRETLTKEPDQPFITLATERKSYDEIIDLLARGASPAEIVAFRLSENTQERVRFLLERNSADELTAEEAAELEVLGEFEQVMSLWACSTPAHNDGSNTFGWAALTSSH